MAPLPFAFSVHHFINSVGADAGFAAIIGLAILVLLYFAQARETSSLREALADAAQRVQQLESRLTQLSRQAGSAAPAPSQPAAPAPASTTPPSAAPAPVRAGGAAVPAAAAVAPVATAVAEAPVGVGAPAGVGAPPLSAATRLIPDAASAPEAAPAPEREVEQTAVATPGPVTPAAGGNGAAVRAPDTAAATLPPRQGPPRVQPRQGAPSPAPRRPAPLVAPRPNPTGPSRLRRVLIGALALLAVAGVVVLLLVLTSSGGGSSSSSSANSAVSSSSAPRSHHGRVAAVNPGNVTVAVLNGTATSGLAHRVALKLTGQGFKQGMVTTATDQTRTTTTIAYLPGHRRAAQAVAAVLKLSPGSVAAVDQNTQAVACPPPAACTATVIVTVGADLASVQ